MKCSNMYNFNTDGTSCILSIAHTIDIKYVISVKLKYTYLAWQETIDKSP